jgi:hypothetical protein
MKTLSKLWSNNTGGLENLSLLWYNALSTGQLISDSYVAIRL